ncbi:hypothetical protein HBA55_12990 [Pseudomaricurvus alkylphenolicus]|uniref:hypothetical protein n=1 Tax=Pseudomaricurvus alkylphenolicus TaxID=1306991 RepID=UPI001423E1B3|nr:hypothetical protein [Pseudomaricurvus alkylphenolicus]NIB40509.1 hypothetical protein [Pseudomaricurvus alkylphenolicus]
MLTKYDDYPVHQTADPIAYAGTDRNFYDRYWFNGYSRDGSIFFACALGVYPNLNIMDGAFSVLIDGVQHNLRVSRHLNMERMHTCIGPLGVEVLEPLQKLRIVVDENEHGISADLTFTGRVPVEEEPRFTKRQGPRTLYDYTRLTQNGDYEGWIEVQGTRYELQGMTVRGTRDRSWGVRYIVGMPDPQKVPPHVDPQSFWLWAPLNFDDSWVLLSDSQDSSGESWNWAAVIGGLGESEACKMNELSWDLEFEPGLRHLRHAKAVMKDSAGQNIAIEFDLKQKFYMSGLGYLHPEWGHGMNKGELAVGYDRLEVDQISTSKPPFYLHVQQFAQVRMSLPDGATKTGSGVLEQAILGPHAPTGLKGLY